MKKSFIAVRPNWHLWGAAFISALLAVTSTASAADLPKLHDLRSVPGTVVQPVEKVDTKVESWVVHPNSNLAGQKVNLPGWNDADPSRSDMQKLLDTFAVRTVADPKAAPADGPFFYVSPGVGRAGIWESTEPGQAFLYYNGRPMKGLTLKGYGGNTISGKSHQPKGSLELSEALRDTLMSSVLNEKGVDSYIGAITFERPGGQANFIRISRTAHRMNDLIDRKGPQLRQTVDHLSALLQDEVGKKLSPEEFTEWLVRRTGRAIALKEYVGFKHGSQTESNIGIGEMVDFGEGSYDPFSYTARDADYQSKSFGNVLKKATDNLKKEYGITADYEKMFQEVYQATIRAARDQDVARVLLNSAAESELRVIGLSDSTIRKIERARGELDFGIISYRDLERYGSIPEEELKILRERTATELLFMENEQMLPEAILAQVGGAEGYRGVLREAVLQSGGDAAAAMQSPAFAAKVTELLEKKADELSGGLAKLNRGLKVWSGFVGAMPEKHLARQTSFFFKHYGSAIQSSNGRFVLTSKARVKAPSCWHLIGQFAWLSPQHWVRIFHAVLA
jgi:hypothetical protein